MDQNLINILLGIICSALGWWAKAMWASLCELQRADSKLAEKISQIEVLVAGHYVKNDRFEELAKAIFAKLDKISDKVDSKADK